MRKKVIVGVAVCFILVLVAIVGINLFFEGFELSNDTNIAIEQESNSNDDKEKYLILVMRRENLSKRSFII